MEVAWNFQPLAGGTQVTISHDLPAARLPLGSEWIGRRIIGDFFIQAIARRTLSRIKELAERAHA